MTLPAPVSSSAALVFDHVWKRYQISVKHDSLRDAIPGMLRGLMNRDGGRNGNDDEAGAGEFWSVRDVSFEVARGETLGMIGPNGAGKSTILKLLSKITRQTRGQIHVRGRLAALIELGGGFHPDLSGRENIYLQGTMLGLSHAQVNKHFDSIVAFSELEKFLETPVKRYSSGMVVRLGFAIAAHVHPDILLLDEVLAVGDLAFQQKCFGRIAELKAAGTTMVFISHDLAAVQKLCDRVVLLQAGQVLAQGSPVDMIRRYREDVLADTKTLAEDGRRNSGPITIRKVSLRNAQGIEIDTLQPGQPLRVDIGLSALRAIQEPAVRVTIERLDGLVCHSTSSRRGGVSPATLHGEGELSVEYPMLNLLPNFYQVIVEVFEGRNPIPVAVLRRGACFQISAEEAAEQGAVYLDHRWMLHATHGGNGNGAGPHAASSSPTPRILS